MTKLEIALLLAIVVLVFLPPDYDPALQLKYFNERWAKKLRERRQ